MHAEGAAGDACLAASPAAVSRLHALATALLSAAGSTDSGGSCFPGPGRATPQPNPRQPHSNTRRQGPGTSQPAGRVSEGLAPPAVPAPVLALQVSLPSLSLRLAAAEAAGLEQAGAAQGLGPPMLRVVACSLNAAIAAEANQLDLRCAAQAQCLVLG